MKINESYRPNTFYNDTSAAGMPSMSPGSQRSGLEQMRSMDAPRRSKSLILMFR